MDRYENLKCIGSGNFGVAKLVKDKWTGELYAVKYIERGLKVILFSSFFLSFLLSIHSIFHLFYLLLGGK